VAALSPTRLLTYRRCPREYRYAFVDGLARKFFRPRPQLTWGAAVHRALREYGRALQERGSRDVDAALRALRREWRPRGYQDSDEAADDLDAASEALRVFDRWHAPGRARPVLVERRLRGRVAGVEIQGNVDWLDELPGGGLRLVDFKTGPRPGFSRLAGGAGGADSSQVDEEPLAPGSRASLQLRWYAHLVRSRYEESPEIVVFHLRRGEATPVPADAEALAGAAAEAAELAGRLAFDSEWAPAPGPHCTGCDFRSICPVWGGSDRG